MGDGETLKKGGNRRKKERRKRKKYNVFSNEPLAFSFSYIGNAWGG
jgi:hypothetical protein